jgi:hypothetical protein
MNTDINGLIKEDITDAIDRGRMWLEKHFLVEKPHFYFLFKYNFLDDCRFI